MSAQRLHRALNQVFPKRKANSARLATQPERTEKKSVEKFSLCKGGVRVGVCVALLFPTETCKPVRTLQIDWGRTNKNSLKLAVSKYKYLV